LALEKGSEYLLSGRYINETLISMMCGQILSEDANVTMTNDIFLWKEVPQDTLKSLQTHAFDAKCK
jgi:hypothetical protein